MSKTPTGPKGFPIIGSLFDLASPKRLDWLQALTDQHGDISKFRLFKERTYLINHPDLVKEILTLKSDNYTKRTIGFKMLKVVLGESTFTTYGSPWKRKRRLAQPSFHKTKISNLSNIMTNTIEEMLDQWEVKCDNKEVIEVTEEMMRLTLKVVVRALFSTGLSEEEVQVVADVFTPLLEATNKRVSFPFQFLYKLPTTKNKVYQEHIDQLDKIIYRIIRERRAMVNKPEDLLQMLMDAEDEETGEPLSDQELRDEAMTIFIAGHETTANAMSWLWATLSQRPDIRDKVEQEVSDFIGHRKPTASDFVNLPYALQVFKEILRVYPPVPVIPRKIENDDTLGDYSLEGKSSILFSPYLLHRHPDFWENPESFNPDRFDKDVQKGQHTFAYLPFGGGPRICMGNNFAMMEAVFIIAMIIQRFRLHLIPDAKIEPLVSLTTRPKYGVPVTLERRQT